VLRLITIRYKIYLLGSIQLALMLLMGSISVIQMAKIGIELVDIAEEYIPLPIK
jgi:methyl-accepting chemotaxis protein